MSFSTTFRRAGAAAVLAAAAALAWGKSDEAAVARAQQPGVVCDRDWRGAVTGRVNCFVDPRTATGHSGGSVRAFAARLLRGRRIAPQVHLALAAQHRPARLGELERPEPLEVDAHQPARNELTKHRAPRRRVDVRPDAEGREPMVPESTNSIAVPAAQHVDDVARAEALPGAVHARERLACRLGRIPGLRRHDAVVAVAAGVGVFLAEVGEQRLPPAGRQLAETQQGVELSHLDALALLLGAGAFDHLAQGDDVRQSVRHPSVGRQSVTAGAARLLVVGLDALREVEVGDEPHVRLVDPHPERDGGDDDHRVFAHERVLVEPALVRAHARVVGEGVESPVPEPLRGLLDLAARQAVDDARVAAVLGVEEAQELLAPIALGHDGVADVRPVEAADEHARIPEPEALGDLAPGGRVRGGGQRDARHVGGSARAAPRAGGTQA